MAFLIAIPVFAWVQRTQEIRTPILLVIFFAAFPDYFHIGELRSVSHSVIGLGGLLLLSLIVLSAFIKLNWVMVLASVLGASAHLIGDMYIGHIYPLFPFSDAIIEMNRFNTIFDLNTELVLSAVAILAIPLVILWDRKRGWGDRKGKEKRYLLLLALIVIVVGLAELVLFAQMNIGRRGLVTVALMMPLFAMPLLLMLGWLKPRWLRLDRL